MDFAEHGMGYRPGGWDEAPDGVEPIGRVSSKRLFGARVGLPSHAMGNVDLVDWQYDQRSTSSCVGHALDDSLTATLRRQMQGSGADWRQSGHPSRRALYTLGREMERATGREELVDDGARPGMLLLAMGRHGIPREEVWPWPGDAHLLTSAELSAAMNEPLPLDVIQDGDDYLLQDHGLVDSDDPEPDVAQALDQGHSVALATDTDKPFHVHDGTGAVEAPKGKSLGWHMVTLHGYDTWKNPKTGIFERRYRMHNSWGTWGEQGWAWATAAWVRAARDITVARAVPNWMQRKARS